MSSTVFFLVVGTGIGAYTAEVLHPCLSDTFHLGKQKAAPAAKHISSRVAKGAGQASILVKEKIGSMRG